MHLMPLYDKIVVKMKNKQEIQSGKLTYVKNLSTSANSTIIGEVVAVGEGRMLANGTLKSLRVKKGDTVLFSKMQGESYDDGTEEYTILSESSILAIVEEDNCDNN